MSYSYFDQSLSGPFKKNLPKGTSSTPKEPPAPVEYSTSTQLPSGLEYKPVPGREAMLPPNKGYNEDLRAICNSSAAPMQCYHALAFGKNFLGRGGKDDVAKWQNWVPNSAEMQAQMLAATGGGTPPSYTWWYVGLGASVLAVGAAVWYVRKRRA
jgi:hypothetical protein